MAGWEAPEAQAIALNWANRTTVASKPTPNFRCVAIGPFYIVYYPLGCVVVGGRDRDSSLELYALKIQYLGAVYNRLRRRS